jgi:hypothetical protein
MHQAIQRKHTKESFWTFSVERTMIVLVVMWCDVEQCDRDIASPKTQQVSPTLIINTQIVAL